LRTAVPVFAATSSSSQQGVQISSQVTGKIAGVGATTLVLTGNGAHTLNGLSVIFNFKLLTLATSPLGSISASLDPSRPSTGSLRSTTFPTTHTQSFYLLLKTSSFGTLVSDSPLTLTATIQSTPPTATYRTGTGTSVVFYRQGDTAKQPVFTVDSVVSDVKPAATQTVNISSFVTANVGGTVSTIQFNGSAQNLVSGTSVLFINKNLTAVNPGVLGATTAVLDTRQNSSGTLGSTTFPTTHTQSFYLQIQSANMGTLVSDSPIILRSTISSCPPNATYTYATKDVPFYRQGDPTKSTVLTISDVKSDISAPTQGKARARASK